MYNIWLWHVRNVSITDNWWFCPWHVLLKESTWPITFTACPLSWDHNLIFKPCLSVNYCETKLTTRIKSWQFIVIRGIKCNRILSTCNKRDCATHISINNHFQYRWGDISVNQQMRWTSTGLLICLNAPLHCPVAFCYYMKCCESFKSTGLEQTMMCMCTIRQRTIEIAMMHACTHCRRALTSLVTPSIACYLQMHVACKH